MPSSPTRILVAAILGALLIATGSRAAAQDAVLALTVTAAETNAPLQGAQVRVDGRGAAVKDAQGLARVAMRASAPQARVKEIEEYRSQLFLRLAAGETREVGVQLVAEAVPLAPVNATAPATPVRSPMLQTFYDRLANHANGKFFTREYIARRHPPQFTDLLLDRTGMRWEYTRGGHRRLRFRTAISGGGTRDCPPKYYINGVPVNVEMGLDPSPDLWVHIDEIEGVEVYPDIPPIQYGGLGTSCGVILVWLREDAGPPSPTP